MVTLAESIVADFLALDLPINYTVEFGSRRKTRRWIEA
jgi:hypothetical protein